MLRKLFLNFFFFLLYAVAFCTLLTYLSFPFFQTM